MRRAALSAITSYLPSGKVDNDELARRCAEWPATRIQKVTGIRSRRIASVGECASDLGIAAATRLFETGACRPIDIDMLLFCTQTPDFFLPSTACIVQHKLGLSIHCGALDVNQGCSGFVYGLSVAKALVEASLADCVLLITAETYSRLIRPDDITVRMLFGDGAAAALVTAISADDEWIGPFVFGTDGSGVQDLIVPMGAMRQHSGGSCAWDIKPASPYLLMDGPKIFDFALKTVPPAVLALLAKADIGMDQVAYFIFHQANGFILEHLRKALGIPTDRFCVHMEESGNTVSATIPLALEYSIEQGTVHHADRVMLVGYGSGYSWATGMIRVNLDASGN